ncbi:hypothetical protein BESB_058860 [Besnoitia besnoiti]|uniref:C2H2-type domain-containing protein n=1 Tax=Besnoitia besnoiti TaxID=94643 RepID=A0A2A9MAT3_BESBE|nr:hypothetical protein BESB_058860 [Besnoitia besnoiti]PFH34999.1 hypothetical protein BESB_058860 [Besnoitia besnoiti]
MTEAELLAAAVDELALEGEHGATFSELLLLLSRSHSEFSIGDLQFQAALWRALYNSPLVLFSLVEDGEGREKLCMSARGQPETQLFPEDRDGHGVPRPSESSAAVEAPGDGRHPKKMSGRSADARCRRGVGLVGQRGEEGTEESDSTDDGVSGSRRKKKQGGTDGDTVCEKERKRRGGTGWKGNGEGEAEVEESDAGADGEHACGDESLSRWRFSVSASVRLRALGVPFSPFLDEEEIEKKMKEVPMILLQAITKQRYAGHWQYQLAIDLGLPPKTVFHHLKPLYRQGLVTHMQLPLPASARPSSFSAKGTSNLTMSALLWHYRFFDFSRMPRQIQATVSLHHLKPLEHQVVEMLKEAPMHAMLESEIHAFCLNAFTTSERFALVSFTAKQFRRLYQKLRGELMRSRHVRRLRAWCPQTQKFEKCLCLCSAASASPPAESVKDEERGERQCSAEVRNIGSSEPGEGASDPSAAGGNDSLSLPVDRVKQERVSASPSSGSPGSLPRSRRDPDADGSAEGLTGEGESKGGEDEEPEGDEGASSMLVWELPLADQVVMLLEARGSAGLLSIEVARYIGTDNKRAGKIFAELERRQRVRKIAERRGRCFMYRYFSSSFSESSVSSAAFEQPGLLASQTASAVAPPRDACGSQQLTGGAEGLPGTPGEARAQATSGETRSAPGSPSSLSPATVNGGLACETDEAAAQTGEGKPQGGAGSGGSGRRRRGHIVNSGGALSRDGRASFAPSASPPTLPDSSLACQGGDGRRTRRCDRAPAEPASRASQPGSSACSAEGQEHVAPALEDTSLAERALQCSVSSSALSPMPSPSARGPAPGSADSAHLTWNAGAAAASGSGSKLGPAGSTSSLQGATSSALPSATAASSLGHKPEDLAASLCLGKNQIRKLRTPQFERRLCLFIEHLQTEGCATIPAISKVLAKAEASVNGPDRKTIQRMAAIAMQAEPRVAMGGVVKPEDREKEKRKDEEDLLRPEAEEDKEERTRGTQRRVGTEVVFYYWRETLTEEQAYRRVAEMITARRIQGCRLAVQRNERLLSGLLEDQMAGEKRTGEKAEQRRALEEEIVKLQKLEERSKMHAGTDGERQGGRGRGMPFTMQPEQVQVSPVLQVVAKHRLRGDSASLHAGGVLQFSQKTLALYGFLFPVMVRVKCLHQFLLQLLASVKQASSPDSCPTSPSPSPRPVPAADIRDSGMTLAFMLRRMPLEIFLRTIGCGYRVKFLDKHLSAPHAPLLLIEDLPRAVFDVLILSSRQLHLKRQRQQPPTLPLTGNNKRSAPAALRRLLAILCRMGLVGVSCASANSGATAGDREGGDQKARRPSAGDEDKPTNEDAAADVAAAPARWQVFDVVALPAFVSEKDPPDAAGVSYPSPSRGTFHLLSPGAFESFWGELQSEVARWIHFNAPLPSSSLSALPTAASGDSRPRKGAGGSCSEEKACTGGANGHNADDDTEALEGTAAAKGEDDGEKGCIMRLCRPKVPLPANFPVAEAFSKRNWKGQILLTPYLRAELDAFAGTILERYSEAGGEELGRLVFSHHSPEVQNLATRLRIPTDVVLRFLMRLFETRGGIGCGFQSLAFHLPDFVASSRRAEDEDDQEDSDVDGGTEGGGRDRAKRRRTGTYSFGQGDGGDGSGDEARAERHRRVDEERAREHERNLLVGKRLVLLHRTRDVRFRCHLCGCLYSLIRALKQHYEKIHKTDLPADSDAYVLPWEKEKRKQKVQQAQEQRQLALAFRRRRKQCRGDDSGTLLRPAGLFGGMRSLDREGFRSKQDEDDGEDLSSGVQQRTGEGELHDSASLWSRDRPRRGTSAASATTAGLLSAAIQRFLRTMRKEDEFVFVAASVVAERLFVAAQRLALVRGGFEVDCGDEREAHPCAPAAAASLPGLASASVASPSPASFFGSGVAKGEDASISGAFGVDGRTLPAASHPVWKILCALCSSSLEPEACMHIFSFLMLRRPVNHRAFNNCRRLAGFDLRSHVNACRVPSLLDSRALAMEQDGGASPRTPVAAADASLFRETQRSALGTSSPLQGGRWQEEEPGNLLFRSPSPPSSWGVSAGVRSRPLSLACRPLNCPRVVLARNVLKMILFTPLSHYRPYAAFEAAQELREREWKAVWRLWSLRGWVTQVKQPLPHHLLPPRNQSAPPSRSSRRERERRSGPTDGGEDGSEEDDKAGNGDRSDRRDGGTRKSPLHALLAAKCRRSFSLSAGARVALFGKLRSLRSLSACLRAILENGESDEREGRDRGDPNSGSRSHAFLTAGDQVPLPRAGPQRTARDDAEVAAHDAHGLSLLRREDDETRRGDAVALHAGEKGARQATAQSSSSSAGISWKEISSVSLGVSPASALILLERMAQEDILLLPAWGEVGGVPSSLFQEGRSGSAGLEHEKTEDGRGKRDPVEDYYARVYGHPVPRGAKRPRTQKGTWLEKGTDQCCVEDEAAACRFDASVQEKMCAAEPQPASLTEANAGRSCGEADGDQQREAKGDAETAGDEAADEEAADADQILDDVGIFTSDICSLLFAGAPASDVYAARGKKTQHSRLEFPWLFVHLL